MAQVHNAITRGNWTDALKRALGIAKDPGGIERYGETLTPGINLWDNDVPEWSYLRKEWFFAQFNSAGAIAAEFSYLGWGLPVASGMLLTIERCSVRGGAATAGPGLAARSVVAATLALSGTSPLNRDTRYAPPGLLSVNFVRQVSSVEHWSGSDPSNSIGGGILWEEQLITAAAYAEMLSTPYIIKPGGVFLVCSQTVNQSLQANVVGRVRQALPGELD